MSAGGSSAWPGDDWRVLVVAKAPVAGRVKTRLGADVGMDRAASLAAASLLDTLRAATETVGPARCHLVIEGDLGAAVDGERLTEAVAGWTVTPQRGDGLDERLAHAHADVADSGPGAVVQVGMDTPQVGPRLLGEVAADLGRHDAVLGPADDGGWWVLALREPARAAALVGVPMSTPATGHATEAALVSAGLSVGTARRLRDVDTVADAEAVAAAAPDGRFAAAWHEQGEVLR